MSEALVFLVMLALFMAGAFWFKMPVGIAMILASIGGTLAAGEGVPVRHLFEGSMGFLDTMLVVATAMIFMKVVEATGALEHIGRVIVRVFAGRPALLLTAMTLFIMLPGMITGSSTAAVMTTGIIAAPILLDLGIPKARAGAIIAMASLFGMAAPPVSIPLMIIGGGVDMPYVGFGMTLMALTLPLAVASTLYLGYHYVKRAEWDELRAKASLTAAGPSSWRLYLPFGAAAAGLAVQYGFPSAVEGFGIPLVMLLASLFGLASGQRLRFGKVAYAAVRMALGVLAILAGVGVFIQVMTLTGVRGYLVTTVLSLPDALLYAGIAVAMPLFGALSSFGSASVMGVPFLLALVGPNDIVIACALSVLACLGDMVPPTALCGIFAARVVQLEDYRETLGQSLVPMVAAAGVAMLAILFAAEFSF